MEPPTGGAAPAPSACASTTWRSTTRPSTPCPIASSPSDPSTPPTTLALPPSQSPLTPLSPPDTRLQPFSPHPHPSPPPAPLPPGREALELEVQQQLHLISQQRLVEGRLLQLIRESGHRGSFFDDPPRTHFTKTELKQRWEALMEDVGRLPLTGEAGARVLTTAPVFRPLSVGFELGQLPPAEALGRRSVSAISPTSQRAILARLAASTSPLAVASRWLSDIDQVGTGSPNSSLGERLEGVAERVTGRGQGEVSAQSGGDERSVSSASGRGQPRYYHLNSDRAMDDVSVGAHSQQPSSPHSSVSSGVLQRSLSSNQLSAVFAVELPLGPSGFLQRSHSSPPRHLLAPQLRPQVSHDLVEGLQEVEEETEEGDEEEEEEEGRYDSREHDELPPAPGSLLLKVSQAADSFTDGDDDLRDSNASDERVDEELNGGDQDADVQGGSQQSQQSDEYSPSQRYGDEEALSVGDGFSDEPSIDDQQSRLTLDDAQSDLLFSSSQSYDDEEVDEENDEANDVDDGQSPPQHTDSEAASPALVSDADYGVDSRGADSQLSPDPYSHEADEQRSSASHLDGALDSNRSSAYESDDTPHPRPFPSPALHPPHPTPLAAKPHTQRRFNRPARDGEAQPSWRANPSPFEESDHDLDDAVWINDDDDFDRQQPPQPPQPTKPWHPYPPHASYPSASHPPFSSSRPTHSPRAGPRDLLSIFQRVVQQLERIQPQPVDPVEDDVRLVARLLQRLLDRPGEQWQTASAAPRFAATDDRERAAYDHEERQRFSATGAASASHGPSTERGRHRSSPPADIQQHTRGNASVHSERPAHKQPHAAVAAALTRALFDEGWTAPQTPHDSHRNPHQRHHPHRSHPHMQHPQPSYDHFVPQHAAGSAETPLKATLRSPSSSSAQPLRFSASAHVVDVSHGGLSHLGRPSAPKAAAAIPVPHVTVTGPAAITVRLGDAPRSHQRKGRSSMQPTESYHKSESFHRGYRQEDGLNPPHNHTRTRRSA